MAWTGPRRASNTLDTADRTDITADAASDDPPGPLVPVDKIPEVPFYLRPGIGGGLRSQTGHRPTFDRDGIRWVPGPGGVMVQYPFDTPAILRAPGQGHAVSLERSSTNLAVHSNDLTQGWSGAASFTIAALEGIFPDSSGWKVTNDGSATFRSLSQAIGALGSAPLAASWIVRNVNATADLRVGIRDVTAADWVVLANWEWYSDTATVQSSGAGTNVSVGVVDLGGGLYRVWAAGTPVNAANTGALYIYPTGTTQNTDSAEVYHGQVEVQPAPTSPIITGASTTSRVVERLLYAGAAPWPQGLIAYVKVVFRGMVDGRWLYVGGTTVPRWIAVYEQGGTLRTHVHDGTDSDTASIAPGASIGDVLEVVATLNPNGRVAISRRVNGASFGTVKGSSSPLPILPTDWSGRELSVGSRSDGTEPALVDLVEAKVALWDAVDNASNDHTEALVNEMERVQVNALGELVT